MSIASEPIMRKYVFAKKALAKPISRASVTKAGADLSSERDLLARVMRRDASALAALYDLHGARVYSLAMMILGESMMAQEVTQDTFLRLWQQPERYRYESGHFVSWLLTITRHLAIDRLRRERRAPADLRSIDTEEFAEPPDASQADELRWRDLQQTFAHLPLEQRDVVQLAFYHGMSQSEIAEHVGAPLGTVKTRMRLALDKLRAVFASD